jgi:hypothetical protein
VAITLKEKNPSLEGVPVIRPVGPIVNPGGNKPAIKLNEIGDWPPDVCI